MKNMNYTSDVEYETEEKKKFQITRGMVLLAAIALIAIIVIVIIIVSTRKPPKEEYTVQDFNSLEQRMVMEAPNYVIQKQIVLTEQEYKIELEELLVKNGGPIDPEKQKAAKICDGYVIAKKEDTEKYFAYIKCGDKFTTYGYVSNESEMTTTTAKKEQKDTTKPDITLIGDKEIVIYQGDAFSDPGAKAIDNVDGDISSNIKVLGNVNTGAAGTYTLIYSVSDKAGNKAEVKREIRVVTRATTTTKAPVPTTTKRPVINTTTRKTTTKKVTTTTARPTAPPTITLKGSRVITLYVGDTYKEPGYSAVDSLGTSITANVNVSGNVNTTTPGTYYISYKVTDRYGNSSSVTRTVTVKQKTISVNSISITPNVIELNAGQKYTFNVIISPTNATNKSVTWTSSNPSIATVSNGVVTAKARGTATITVKTANGKTATAKVTVK